MRKSYLFVAAGTAVLFCGCPTTPVTGTRTVIPAMDDPAAIEQPAQMTQGTPSWEAPAKPQPQVTVPTFEPMTGVTSSGGVDRAPRSKGKKSGKKSGSAIAVAGGKYVVQPGDTPERIARKLRVRLSALMAANNLDQQSARRLQIGQKLVIPGKNAKVVPAKKSGKGKKAVAVKNAPDAIDNDGKYVIQSGDTPERIARKHRVRLSELLKANNLDAQSARRLQIGQKLVIPGKTVVTEVKPPVTEDVPDLPVPVMPPVNADATATDVTATDTAATGTTATTADAPAATDTAAPAVTTEATDSESDIQMVSIEADTTAAALAAKYNVSAEVISQKNSGKTEFMKGDLVFVPKN